MKLHTKIGILCAFILLVPSFTQAAMSANDALRTPDDAVVTSGEFIRAAVIILGLEDLNVDQNKELPYRRVARGYEPYVRVAQQKNALEPFGYDLLLSQGITRGNALHIVVHLTGLNSAKPAPFKDVRAGTSYERAVRVAVDKGWMQPIRDDLFGIQRKLTGSEARLLLRKAAGEAGPIRQDDATHQNITTIKVNYQSNQRLMNLPKTQILESIWSVIERDFLYTDNIDTDEAAWKAAEGLVESLGDRYTTFMRPERAKQFQTQIKGEIIGIGAQVEFIDGQLTIVSPIKGSPAEAAGLLPGDKVLKVNGEELKGLSFLDAVDKVRGPKGSKATLTINRNGLEINFDVIRDIIKVEEATITWQGQIAIVELTQFGQITNDELRPKMVETMKKDPKGIVLDLRSNPGGLLNSANTVVSIFVPRGTVYVKTHSRKSEDADVTNLDQIVGNEIPVVVLVNEGSASASEIVAGALKDLGRATIVGSKTFGKGTVQQVMQFNDQSSLKMTIAQWFTPKGNKIDGIGVSPDIGVSETEGRDEPLLRALELLR